MRGGSRCGFRGKSIKNVHLDEWNKRAHECNFNTIRTLLDGTADWPSVIGELERIGYGGT